jgi:hypothetical protein
LCEGGGKEADLGGDREGFRAGPRACTGRAWVVSEEGGDGEGGKGSVSVTAFATWPDDPTKGAGAGDETCGGSKPRG